MASKQSIYVDIARYDEETNTAYGYATTEALDSHDTVIDLESVKSCLPEYMKFGNIREMHDLKAAGTTEEATVDDKGLYIAAKVVDPTAQLKCKEKVYKGFSIGGKKDFEKDGRIFLKSITEISLVDRPSNPECLIDAYRIFKGDEDMPDKQNETVGEVLARIQDSGKDFKGVEVKPEDTIGDILARVDKREDVKPDEGKKKYGDVAFADEKNKKYPIDTAKHIKAAWNMISKKKNAAKYEADDLKTIKDKIIAAWKDKIDKDGPPGADDTTKAAGGDVERGKYVADSSGWGGTKYVLDETDDCLTALYALQTLISLRDREQGEDEQIPEQIDALAAAISAVKDFIQSEIMENDDDTGVTGGDIANAANADLTRKGAAISKDNLDRIQTMHDHCADMGAVCRCADVSKADGGGDDIKRLATLESDITRLSGELDTIRTEKETLVTRITELEKEPVAPKAALMAVTRGDDVGTVADTIKRVEDTDEYKNGTDIQRAQLKMKESLEKPVAFYR